MSNLYSTKQKIAIAQSVIENACGNNRGITQIKHYITVDAYIDLLFIELHMIDLYSNAKAR